jgi:hypothetical protein
VLQRLSTPDRLLPVWIVGAAGVGLGLDRLLPGLDDALACTDGGLKLASSEILTNINASRHAHHIDERRWKVER